MLRYAGMEGQDTFTDRSLETGGRAYKTEKHLDGWEGMGIKADKWPKIHYDFYGKEQVSRSSQH